MDNSDNKIVKDSPKPNLFVVGAAKSGTTTLWKYFQAHENIFVNKNILYKEPSYFSNFGKDLGLDNYLSLFRDANDSQKYVCDLSNAYLTDPASADAIYKFNQNSKIIIVLRNPVSRAYSLYNWMVQHGYEYLESFEIAAKYENVRSEIKIPNYFEPEYYWSYMYLNSGMYFEQVKRYRTLFGDNLLILNFKSLVKQPQETFSQICSFLNIPTKVIIKATENESFSVYSACIQFLLRKVSSELIKKSISIENKTRVAIIREVLMCLIRNFIKLLKAKKISTKCILFMPLILLKIIIHSKKINFKNINTIEQRDFLLKFGIIKRKPKKLPARICKKLSLTFIADLSKLREEYNINFLNE